jgi:multidrug efflux system membrane fusion protein
MNKGKVFLWFCLSLLVFAFINGCGSSETTTLINQKDSLIAVETADVTFREISFPIHTAGIVALKEEIKLSFKVGGIIEKIYVEEGETVIKGQVMAELDLSEIVAQVNIARSGYEKLKRDLERVQALYQENVATLEQLQDTETAFEIARSQLEMAEFNLIHSTIVAPSNGKILKRFAQEKELIAMGMPVFYFASTDKSWVIRFGVTDRDVVRLKLGDKANVYLDVYPDIVFSAKVSEISEAADLMSGTFEVELEIEERDEYKLVSGFIAKVDIYPSQKMSLAVIPMAALVEGDKTSGYVFTIYNDPLSDPLSETLTETMSDPLSETLIVIKKPITIYKILTDEVAVLSGLEDVKIVITDGVSYLVNGAKVKIVHQEKPFSLLDNSKDF